MAKKKTNQKADQPDVTGDPFDRIKLNNRGEVELIATSKHPVCKAGTRHWLHINVARKGVKLEHYTLP